MAQIPINRNRNRNRDRDRVQNRDRDSGIGIDGTRDAAGNVPDKYLHNTVSTQPFDGSHTASATAPPSLCASARVLRLPTSPTGPRPVSNRPAFPSFTSVPHSI